jgi:hypothetical protein
LSDAVWQARKIGCLQMNLQPDMKNVLETRSLRRLNLFLTGFWCQPPNSFGGFMKLVNQQKQGDNCAYDPT